MKFIRLFLALAAGFAGLEMTASASVPRAEYPRPQFERSDWVNLNGEWTYCLDLSNSGLEKGFRSSDGFDGKITVPFAPESKLSGVEFKDFITGIWYQRKITVPQSWQGRNVRLNFGASVL